MEIQIDSAADQLILTALREGRQRQAANLMVRYYGSTVYNVCRSLVSEVEAAEDLTQEAFRRAFSDLAGIQGAPSPRGWLVSVAQRCCADHLRDLAEVEMPEPDPAARLDDGGGWRVSESLHRRLEVLAAALPT
jgi:RNA polymerase sigma-70 factor (ECF subfamily)